MCVRRGVAQVRVSTLVVKSATEESARFKATRPRSNTSVTSCVVTTQILSACWCQTISPSGRDSLVYLQQKPTSRRCITPNNSKFSKPIEYCKIFDEVHSSQRKAKKNLPLDSKTRHLKLHFLNLSGAVGDLRITCRGNPIHH